MNLNKLAKEVTVAEGLKKPISIAQVKEVLKIVFTILSKLSDSKIRLLINICKQD